MTYKSIITIILVLLFPVAFATGDNYETIRINEQFGVIDSDLSPISPLLDYVLEGVTDDLLVNRMDLVFTDSNGNFIREVTGSRMVQYKKGYSFSTSAELGAFAINKSIGIIPLDKRVERVTSSFDRNGFALITLRNRKRNYLNTDLKIAFPQYEFDDTGFFRGDYAKVGIDRQDFLLSLCGELIPFEDLDFNMDYIIYGNNGLHVYSSNKKLGLCDSQLNPLLAAKYFNIGILSPNIILINENGDDSGLKLFNLKTKEYSSTNFVKLKNFKNGAPQKNALTAQDSAGHFHLLMWDHGGNKLSSYGPYKSLSFRFGRWYQFEELDGTKGYLSPGGEKKYFSKIEEEVRNFKK